MTPDPVSTALDQVAACRTAIADLDAREAAHYGELSDQAAQLCPPDRTATRSPSAAASRTPAATSATSAARSTAAGRRAPPGRR